MLEWPFLFLAGILGSAHCVGMCGGFVLSIGAAASDPARTTRFVSCCIRRVDFLPMPCWATAGFAGWRLTRAIPTVHLSAILALVAGAVLVYQGLAATGVLRRRGVAAGSPPCLASSFFGGFLRMPGRTSGVSCRTAHGTAPVRLAVWHVDAGRQHARLGESTATMAIFGLGTVPILVATGYGDLC